MGEENDTNELRRGPQIATPTCSSGNDAPVITCLGASDICNDHAGRRTSDPVMKKTLVSETDAGLACGSRVAWETGAECRATTVWLCRPVDVHFEELSKREVEEFDAAALDDALAWGDGTVWVGR